MEIEEKQHVSLLDIDTKNKIRSLYIDNTPVIEIQRILGINPGTWDNFYYLNKGSDEY